jgi:hypothetical protein
MKSAGHTAYDAFRTQVGWLPEWDKLTEDMRQAWDKLAGDTMTAASQ